MARKPEMSRRDLLLGMVNRFKGTEESAQTVSGIQSDQLDGDRCLSSQDFDQAVTAYRTCLQKTPEHKEARAKLAYCLYKQDRYVQAICEFKRVLKKGDDNFSSLYLGLCHARKGDLKNATKAWEGYFNPKRPEIMREINVQVALLETGEKLEPQEVAQAVESVASANEGIFDKTSKTTQEPNE
jgi:tetratricopeptide (TPR) repeat protein